MDRRRKGSLGTSNLQLRARGKGTGNHQLRFQLFGKRANQLHAQGVGFGRCIIGRHSGPVIGDGKLEAARAVGQGNVQVAVGKAVAKNSIPASV